MVYSSAGDGVTLWDALGHIEAIQISIDVFGSWAKSLAIAKVSN